MAITTSDQKIRVSLTTTSNPIRGQTTQRRVTITVTSPPPDSTILAMGTTRSSSRFHRATVRASPRRRTVAQGQMPAKTAASAARFIPAWRRARSRWSIHGWKRFMLAPVSYRHDLMAETQAPEHAAAYWSSTNSSSYNSNLRLSSSRVGN